MNEDQLKAGASKAAGKVESAAGAALNDREVEAQDDARQAQGHTEGAAGAAHDTISKASDIAHDAVSNVAGRAGQAYGRASDAVETARSRVDPFVREKPYAALGLAAGAGLVLGLLLAGTSVKTIYVRPAG